MRRISDNSDAVTGHLDQGWTRTWTRSHDQSLKQLYVSQIKEEPLKYHLQNTDFHVVDI